MVKEGDISHILKFKKQTQLGFIRTLHADTIKHLFLLIDAFKIAEFSANGMIYLKEKIELNKYLVMSVDTYISMFDCGKALDLEHD